MRAIVLYFKCTQESEVADLKKHCRELLLGCRDVTVPTDVASQLLIAIAIAIAYCLLLIAYYLLLIAYCLLLIAYCYCYCYCYCLLLMSGFHPM